MTDRRPSGRPADTRRAYSTDVRSKMTTDDEWTTDELAAVSQRLQAREKTRQRSTSRPDVRLWGRIGVVLIIVALIAIAVVFRG